jgi:hypothetical protein
VAEVSHLGGVIGFYIRRAPHARAGAEELKCVRTCFNRTIYCRPAPACGPEVHSNSLLRLCCVSNDHSIRLNQTFHSGQEQPLYDSAMPAQQNFKNHASFAPAWHFFVVPVALINIVLSIYYTIHQWPMHSRSHLWWIVMSFAFFFAVGTSRQFALKDQDRIIRLEEKLRYASLLAPAQVVRAQALTLQQIIALRFASDAELPGLIDRAIAESLAPKQIKQAITDWRADYNRI